jgi:methylated-DNA-[protein]-cysteine S-methyltransferase
MAEAFDFETALSVAPDPAGAAEAAARAVARADREGLVDVGYATVESPLGDLIVAVTPRGLVRLAYDDGRGEMVLEQLAEWLSPRVLEAPRRIEPVRRQLDDFFEGRRREFDLPLDWSLVHGFGQAVLRNTVKIPYGEVSTYGELAARAGKPRAARATGTALGKNPLPIVVPCHRVVRSGGVIGNYTGGVDKKHYLLELEGALPLGLAGPGAAAG